MLKTRTTTTQSREGGDQKRKILIVQLILKAFCRPYEMRIHLLPKIVKIKKLRISINFPVDSESKQINLNL